jgi:IS605 OrfB family transposase
MTSRRELGAVGADLNADHVAVAELDRFGNLAGHRNLALDVHGLSSAQAEARIADSAAELVLLAKESGKPLVIEALDFRKKKAALRELGKDRARTLSGFAFAQFQARVASRCEREGVELIRVNPAYTSTLGYAKFGSYSISTHVAAAMATGRRGLGFGERLAARSTSPRLGSALVTRLKEIAASRKAGEHVWKFWRQLTPWLRAALRKQNRTRSVPSGGARHPRGGLPPPGTVRSSGDSGFRTPAVLAVGTAAP